MGQYPWYSRSMAIVGTDSGKLRETEVYSLRTVALSSVCVRKKFTVVAEAGANYRRRFFSPVLEPPLLSPPALRLPGDLVKSWADWGLLLSTLGSNT